MRIRRFHTLKNTLFYISLCIGVLLPTLLHNFTPSVEAANGPGVATAPEPQQLQLDSRLPIQTIDQHTQATNLNTKFGSRLNFNVQPGKAQVYSGTAGIFHDTPANYVVGVRAQKQLGAQIFHMGKLNAQLGDSYLQNERWQQGLSTSRWSGETQNNELQVTVDIVDTFFGAPGCTDISSCSAAVKDDIAPILYFGITLQNLSKQAQQGTFLFGSERKFTAENACSHFTTPSGSQVNSLTYAPESDASKGLLFLAGEQKDWSCQIQEQDRAGLSWNYSLKAQEKRTRYLLLGGWNGSQQLFNNTQLPKGCQSEGLYYTKIWATKEALIGYGLDNMVGQRNLLGRAQALEQLLITNNTISPEQRWLVGNTLRSYKAGSWLVGRQDCAGGGYDAAVYEGSYGFLTTVDVLHEYGYFEIMRVPWFFKAALHSVFANATRNQYGTYFQHDQGGEIDGHGNCVSPGKGTPTLRSTCYIPPYVSSGTPMPTEENNNVALLLAYYASVTGDSDFVREQLPLLQEAMQHNVKVGDPRTGIAIHDTATTYDAANDCLHNNAAKAGNLYYQGLKEVAAYYATDYLGSFVSTAQPAWQGAAEKIQQAMLTTYKKRGYLPIADNKAYNNCDGRTIMQGDGLLYLHLSGLETKLNPELLQALAAQYPADVQASTFTSPNVPENVVGKPALILLSSKRVEGSKEQCANYHCLRYTWFSKVMLSGIVADLVYSKHGCASCTHMNMDEAAYAYNSNFSRAYADGAREYVGYWEGYTYPRGIISWLYLDKRYVR